MGAGSLGETVALLLTFSSKQTVDSFLVLRCSISSNESQPAAFVKPRQPLQYQVYWFARTDIMKYHKLEVMASLSWKLEV